MPATLTDTYLDEAIRTRLAREEATFELMVQPQIDARRTPIEDASVEWREQDSPYVPVARIRIPAQSIDDAGKRAALRGGRVQPVALPARTSSAREHEPRAARDLPDDG